MIYLISFPPPISISLYIYIIITPSFFCTHTLKHIPNYPTNQSYITLH